MDPAYAPAAGPPLAAPPALDPAYADPVYPAPPAMDPAYAPAAGPPLAAPPALDPAYADPVYPAPPAMDPAYAPAAGPPLAAPPALDPAYADPVYPAPPAMDPAYAPAAGPPLAAPPALDPAYADPVYPAPPAMDPAYAPAADPPLAAPPAMDPAYAPAADPPLAAPPAMDPAYAPAADPPLAAPPGHAPVYPPPTDLYAAPPETVPPPANDSSRYLPAPSGTDHYADPGNQHEDERLGPGDAYHRAVNRQEHRVPGRLTPSEDPNFAQNPAVARPRLGTPGRVVAVTAAKGGVGKSTLSLWLAEAMTDAGLSVCVFDANIAQPDLLGMTGHWKREHLGLAGLVKPTGLRFSYDELDSALLKVDGLGDILPGPPDPVETVQGPALRAAAQAIEMLRDMYAWVIVDTPVASGFEKAMAELVKPYADTILVVVTPYKPAAQDTALWMSAALRPEEQNGLGLDPARIVGVVNQADDKNSGLTVNTLTNKWLTMLNFVAQIPAASGTIANVNQNKWQCPPGAQEQVALLTERICGVSPGAPAKPPSSGGGLLQRFKKKK